MAKFRQQKIDEEITADDFLLFKILLGDNEYQDGIDITDEIFWDYLINKKKFPKTSLPSLVDFEDKVNGYTNMGDDVIIITISSKISGTYNFIRLLFEDNPKVSTGYYNECKQLKKD